MLKLSDYNFHLPEELIARYPAEKRDESRLMIVNRKSGTIHIESVFRSIEKHFIKGDLLVFNETRVSKRRVYLKDKSGREFECVFLEKNFSGDKEVWKCLLKNVRKLKPNEKLFSNREDIYFTLNRNEEGDIFFISFCLNFRGSL